MNTALMNPKRTDAVARPAHVGVGTVYHFDPLCDSRWVGFVGSHPNATIFHTRQWLEALRRTYGYQPLAVTTSAPEEPLRNAIVVCQINSWLTGTRLVSLPFSDHCDPLVDNGRDLETLIGSLFAEQKVAGCKYVELRPLNGLGSEGADLGGLAPTKSFFLHILDLTPDTGQLYRRFHNSCIQRKIKKAEKEGLEYEEGRSEELLAQFYKLMLMTRRRHQLPPQPAAWFRNLVECMAECLKIRVVSYKGRAIAGILTVHVGRTHVYKYGCSDAQFHNLGGMPLLMWRAIQDAKNMGASEFDFGRSECDNEGLVAFKDHWGGIRRTLTYYQFPRQDANGSHLGWRMRTAKSVFSNLPDSMLATMGRLLYRHIG